MPMIEREVVTVVVPMRPELQKLMPFGDAMAHCTFGLLDDPSPDTAMRVIACVGWFVNKDQYKVVNTQPTCVRCIATRRP